MNRPIVLPDGSLVVPSRDKKLVVDALCDLLAPRHANAPVIRARLRAIIDAAQETGNAATLSGATPENLNSKLGSAEAARVLGVNPRRIRQLGQELGGTRLPNGRWEFDAALVYAEALKRGRVA
ncbi:hypothetical protein [Streptomyces sp. MB09-02B]|uniref:hypothetical protein n=1 Tax=Streptomyces sp. MB09-02B TaxID=3028667 RepID=UPI0029B0D92C|nr:hypothetical protein [Streptomyces sp. MB09-02B]MDX3641430.1 hypothetical protein [Streptomyces sp. MB09-02B]